MIGNDLIDLRLALAGTKSDNSRFLKKVFTKSEINFIRNSDNPEICIWKLWSMKETAYKVNQREFSLKRKLNPVFYECCEISENYGVVVAGNNCYNVQTEIKADYIHSYSANQTILQYIYHTVDFRKDQLTSVISERFQIKKEDIQLEKNLSGVPSIRLKNAGKKFPFSMSHHGDFTAFVIPLINS